MKRVTLTLLTLAFLAIGTTGAIAQQAKAIKVDLSTVTKLKLDVSCKIELTQSTTPLLAIEANDEVLNEITSKVSGGELSIKRDKRNQEQSEVTIYLSIQNLESIEVVRDVNLEGKGELKFNKLAIKVNGVLTADLNLTTTHFDIHSSGVLTLTASGKTDVLNLEMPGVGKANLLNLKVKKATVEVDGVGKAQVDVSEYLQATVNGVGKISYKGHPALKLKVSGVGSISEI